MPDMVEVMIDSVRVSLMSPQRMVVLKEKDIERYLPIWVGPFEAEAITVALQEVEMIRPLTHDLLKNVFGSFNAKITRVEIVSLREDIFYGNIVTLVDDREMNIDSRPSDAIALAVRVHVPILVDAGVMATAGILPEKNLEEDQPSLDEKPVPAGADEGQDRLSIFKDFIDKLDMDDLDEKKKPGKKN